MSLIKNYLNSHQIKLLTKDELYSLIPLAQAGDLKAREKIIIHNLPYVLKIAAKNLWASSGVLDFDDLVNEGTIGLIRAIKTFDISLDLAFTTYSDPWIRQAIGRFIENNSGPVRTPVYLQTLQKKYRKLRDIENPDADDFYLRQVAHQNEKTIANLRYSISHQPHEINIDAGFEGSDDEGSDGEQMQLEAIVDENQINVNLLDANTLLEMLDDSEQELMRLRLLGWSLKAVAGQMHLSRERIRQLEEIAIFKMKAMIGNVKDNKVFQLREALANSYIRDIEENLAKVNSFNQENGIYGICLDCANKAMELKENSTKRQTGNPSWIKAECDVCKKVTAVAGVKIFEYPIVEVNEIKG